MWRKLRIFVLLLILLFVALNTYFDRFYSTQWNDALRVAVFPINADGSSVTERYIQSLTSTPYEPIEPFFAEEGKHYGLQIDQPIRLTLGKTLLKLPPALPPDTGRLGAMIWSLKTRYWSSRIDGPPGTEIKLYLLYHDPERSQSLPHSVGLQKG